MLQNNQADMAQTAVVMALIILVAVGAFSALGNKIADTVNSVTNAI